MTGGGEERGGRLVFGCNGSPDFRLLLREAARFVCPRDRDDRERLRERERARERERPRQKRETETETETATETETETDRGRDGESDDRDRRSNLVVRFLHAVDAGVPKGKETERESEKWRNCCCVFKRNPIPIQRPR